MSIRVSIQKRWYLIGDGDIAATPDRNNRGRTAIYRGTIGVEPRFTVRQALPTIGVEPRFTVRQTLRAFLIGTDLNPAA